MDYAWEELRTNPDLKEGDVVECVLSDNSAYVVGQKYTLIRSGSSGELCIDRRSPMDPQVTGGLLNGLSAWWVLVPKQKKKNGFAIWVKDHA